jgi:hypothetical protein
MTSDTDRRGLAEDDALDMRERHIADLDGLARFFAWSHGIAITCPPRA